jgi:hypothetical protein
MVKLSRTKTGLADSAAGSGAGGADEHRGAGLAPATGKGLTAAAFFAAAFAVPAMPFVALGAAFAAALDFAAAGAAAGAFAALPPLAAFGSALGAFGAAAAFGAAVAFGAFTAPLLAAFAAASGGAACAVLTFAALLAAVPVPAFLAIAYSMF